MIARSICQSSAAIAVALILGSAGAAQAQTAGQSTSSPSIDELNSAAAMNDTVNDPRIAKSEGAKSGTWKWVVPPVKMKGAFDNNDPIGVITGRKIPADCSLNWTDPDTHRLFCFSSATSLVYFLDAPKENTARAEKIWRQLKSAPAS